MKIDVSIVISILALLVSSVTLYLQWFRIRGPIISLLNNEKQEQRAIYLESYDRLPEIVRQHFPKYEEKHPGYAEVVLNFANAGDRIGIAEILKINVTNSPAWSATDRIRASYSSFTLVPAYEMRDQVIILRNIQPIDSETSIDLNLKIAWGGASPKTGKYERKGEIERTIKIKLVPSAG